MRIISFNRFGFVSSLIGLVVVMYGVYDQSYIIAAIGCSVATIRKD